MRHPDDHCLAVPNGCFWAISRRVRWGRMTGSSWPTQPDCHNLRFGQLGSVADVRSLAAFSQVVSNVVAWRIYVAGLAVVGRAQVHLRDAAASTTNRGL